MLALLILNLEQSGKYTPFPRESYRSAAKLILWGQSSGTWSFHSIFSFFLLLFFCLLEGVQQVIQKGVVCMWVSWLGFERVISGDWFCVCVHASVCSWELAISTARCLRLSTLWALEEALSLQYWHNPVSSHWKQKGISTPHLLLHLL